MEACINSEEQKEDPDPYVIIVNFARNHVKQGDQFYDQYHKCCQICQNLNDLRLLYLELLWQDIVDDVHYCQDYW